MGQFTDTEFAFATQQYQHAQAGGITQGFEKVIGFHHMTALCGLCMIG
jgi:hypothetical protein